MENQHQQKMKDLIEDEVIVDCCDREEVISGWYHWLYDQMTFPYKARCIHETRGSLLLADETVTVTDIGDMEECAAGMRVLIEWQGRTCSVPLELLVYEAEDKSTQQAIEAWHYWIQQGYSF